MINEEKEQGAKTALPAEKIEPPLGGKGVIFIRAETGEPCHQRINDVGRVFRPGVIDKGFDSLIMS
jgi:hypothetical protein